MIHFLRKYQILLISQVTIVGLWSLNPAMSVQAWLNSLHFTAEILLVLPPVFLLIGLVDAWVPVGTFETYLGKDAGVKGMCFAALVGSIAAGPLFAAFPIAASLARKGSRVANTVIFLEAWATIKIPMLMMESQFVGVEFSLLRLALTLPCIFAIGILVEMVFERRQT